MAKREVIYDRIGVAYREQRRPDPRIARRIAAALGDAGSVVNVGAGAGSYEPARTVAAVDVSTVMLAQRPQHAAPAVRATATRLPLRDGAVAASLAILTVHHWPDLDAGLAEMKRVARDRAVLLTWDPDHEDFWLTRDYFPEVHAVDRAIFPTMERLRRVWGDIAVEVVPVPHDCTDGFLGAYWRRPYAYLNAKVRAGMSTFDKVSVEAGLAALREDLVSGVWHRSRGHLSNLPELDVGYRLVTATIR